MERNIKQNNVKWMEADNANLTRGTYHGYYGRVRKHKYYDDYNGNSALCNKRNGISEDGEIFLPIEKVEQNGLVREKVCKSCLKIYDKLETN